jgi:hypothetical protein
MVFTVAYPSVETAHEFVKSVDLPAPPPSFGISKGVAKAPESAFDIAKDQATVVGSDVISFVKGVTPEQRTDIVNAALLAQLVANKKVMEPTTLPDVVGWYEEYFDVLSHIGFVIQDKGFAVYEEKSQDFEAHKAILELATALLAGTPGALVVLKKTLEALAKMAGDSPWITLYERESRSANTARFQASLVSQDENALFLVSLIAFGLEATSEVKQVLFFKFRKNEVKLQHHSGKVTINAPVLASVRDQITQRLIPFTTEYVEHLPDLGASASG